MFCTTSALFQVNWKKKEIVTLRLAFFLDFFCNTKESVNIDPDIYIWVLWFVNLNPVEVYIQYYLYAYTIQGMTWTCHMCPATASHSPSFWAVGLLVKSLRALLVSSQACLRSPKLQSRLVCNIKYGNGIIMIIVQGSLAVGLNWIVRSFVNSNVEDDVLYFQLRAMQYLSYVSC